MRDFIDRREFLHRSGAGLGALLAAAACGPGAEVRAPEEGATARAGSTAGPGPGARPGAAAISLQLYTLRTLLERDFEGTLREVAQVGYRNVELAGQYGRTPQAVRALLDAHGLRAPSAHVPLADFQKDLPGVLAAAEALGNRYVICPYARETAEDGWRRLAGEFNRFGRAARERGLQFAYHNHDFEFVAPPGGGPTPYDLLLAETDPQLVQMELDLFWAVRAGQEPTDYFTRHPGRFPLVHVKDMRDVRGARGLGADAGERALPHMADVGAGEIDFRRIFARAAAAGLEYYVVEHDAPPDPLASVRASFDGLRRILAA